MDRPVAVIVITIGATALIDKTLFASLGVVITSRNGNMPHWLPNWVRIQQRTTG